MILSIICKDIENLSFINLAYYGMSKIKKIIEKLELQKIRLAFFANQNNIPMLRSLKASVIGFVIKIMNMYFFETSLYKIL